MERLGTLAQWRDWAEGTRRAGRAVSVVPTMGALHEGHRALVAAAVAAGDEVLVTSFVNPRQFENLADLTAYPRTPEADAALVEAAGAAALATPSLEEMWPDHPAPTATTVHVAGLSEVLEGAQRPGHFDGVASVVAKILILSGPCRLWLGEKDFQQVAVISQMVRDLALPVSVATVPTVREDSGLALSSRNVRLSEAGRRRALGLVAALRAAGEHPARASVLRARMARVMAEAGVEVAYAEVVDPASLEPCDDSARGRCRALVAGYVEGVRLIDNDEVEVGED